MWLFASQIKTTTRRGPWSSSLYPGSFWGWGWREGGAGFAAHKNSPSSACWSDTARVFICFCFCFFVSRQKWDTLVQNKANRGRWIVSPSGKGRGLIEFCLGGFARGKKQICKLRVVGKKKRSEKRGLETRRSTNKWDGGVLAKKDNCGRVITSFPLSAADCERWRVMRTACVRPALLELLSRPVRWAWPQRASLHCCLHTGRRHKQNLGCFPLHVSF